MSSLFLPLTHTHTLPPSLPLSPCICAPRTEALFIGDIYTELLGEFGRFVGGSVNAVTTLKKGLFVSPLALKVSHLEKSLKDLITFLEVGAACAADLLSEVLCSA